MCYGYVQHVIRKVRMSTLCSENTESTQATAACEYWFLGTMRNLCIKMEFFVFQSNFSYDGVPWWYPTFHDKKYGILAFKWRVVSIFLHSSIESYLQKTKGSWLNLEGCTFHYRRKAFGFSSFPNWKRSFLLSLNSYQ